MARRSNPDDRFVYPDGAPFHTKGVARFLSTPVVQLNALIVGLAGLSDEAVQKAGFATHILPYIGFHSSVLCLAHGFIWHQLGKPTNGVARTVALDTWGQAIGSDLNRTRQLRCALDTGASLFFFASAAVAMGDALYHSLPTSGLIIATECLWLRHVAGKLDRSTWVVAMDSPGRPAKKELLPNLGFKAPSFRH